ncbi:hypothetical protein FRB93_006000 [Tulasnella sp. JGI-2019a]|nr:hypothetical protein FRB93_006000 [Tulasnella sp. JGI-2019a]
MICPVHEAAEETPPFIQGGQIRFQAHQVGWIICGFFTFIAVGVSWWLINKHLANYTNKGQQRYIVRCLFLVPVYAIISTLSYILYDSYASVLILIRDAYESVVLHAFFWLLLEYISHDAEEQKEVFREIHLQKWMFPLGFIKRKPSGLYFLQIMKWGILQYAFLRPTCTIVALILNIFGLYCEESYSPAFGNIYITTIVSISVSMAMYCLIQLYVPIADHLKQHHPLLKFFAIKAVVFLTFWQSILLSVLTMLKVVKDVSLSPCVTQYMTAAEINIGFAALLETFEMMIFAFLHIRAFSYLPYRLRPGDGSKNIPTSKWRSLGHVLDFRDVFRQIWTACVYSWDRIRGYEPEQSGRNAHLQQALGRRRVRAFGKDGYDVDTANSEKGKSVDVATGLGHHWLKLNLHDEHENEMSADHKEQGLEDAIDAELRRLRMISEHNRQAGKLQSQPKGSKKKSSTHRRYAAASQESEPPYPFTGSAFGFHREGEMYISSFGQQRPSKAAYGNRSFWRGLYDRTVGTGRGGHRQVLHEEVDEEDDRGEMGQPENPSWKGRATYPPASPELEDRPPRSIVGLPVGPINWSLYQQPRSGRGTALVASAIDEEELPPLPKGAVGNAVMTDMGQPNRRSLVPSIEATSAQRVTKEMASASLPTRIGSAAAPSSPLSKSTEPKTQSTRVIIPSPLSPARHSEMSITDPLVAPASPTVQGRDRQRRSGIQDGYDAKLPSETGHLYLSMAHSMKGPISPSDVTTKATPRSSPPSKDRSRRRTTLETSARLASQSLPRFADASRHIAPTILVGPSSLSTPPRFSPSRSRYEPDDYEQRYSPDPLDSPPPPPILRSS